MADPPKLQCLMFCEFHHEKGPMITYQVPEGFFAADTFEKLSGYLITKPGLYGRLITLTAHGYKVIGHPVALEDSVKYKERRNVILFNMTFVFRPEDDTTVYQPIVRKMASILHTLEYERSFIFNQDTKAQLPKIMAQIFDGLNTQGECDIPVDEANTIRLKLLPKFPTPPEVKDYEVPVRIQDLDALVSPAWDLTLQQIIPFIDGIAYVKRIAKEAGVDIDLTKRCLQHLLYYNCIKMIDIFQYSNVYTATPQVGRLLYNTEMQQECARYIASKSNMPPPPPSLIFSLYASLTPSMTFREFCQEKDLVNNNIDDRKFITFGLINQLIRRIHKYPLMVVGNPLSGNVQLSGSKKSKLPQSVFRMLDGRHSFDEICCFLGQSYGDVVTQLRQETQFVVLSR